MLDYINKLKETIDNPETTADLHIHTIKSDGSKNTIGVIDASKNRGVSCIAITDHNTIGTKGGVADYAESKYAKSSDIFVDCGGLTVIPGVEITSVVYPYGKNGTKPQHEKIHMVVLGADRNPDLAFNKVLELKHKSDIITDYGIFGYCNLRFGTNFTLSEIKKMIQMEKFKNPNFYAFSNVEVARLCEKRLKERGKSNTNKKYILDCINGDFGSKLRKMTEKRLVLDAEDMISLAKCAGGTTIWAHPRMLAQKDLKDKMLDILKSKGLDGVEMFYSINVGRDGDHTSYLNLPGIHIEKDMLWSGGSDFHTTAGAKNRIGLAYGHPIHASKLTVLNELIKKQQERTSCLIDGKELPYGDNFYSQMLYQKYEKEYKRICEKSEKGIYFAELDPRKDVSLDTDSISIDDKIITEVKQSEGSASRTWKDDLKTAYNLIQEENISEDSKDSGMETN